MHLLDQRILGVAILFVLSTVVTIGKVAPASNLDNPKDDFLAQSFPLFNLIFWLVMYPVAA